MVRSWLRLAAGISLVLAACSDKSPTAAPDRSFTPSFALASEPVEWDGEGGDGLWSNPLNWSGDVVPADGDTVFIQDAGMVHVDMDASVSRFRFGTADPSSNPVADELIVDPGVTFTVSDDPSDNSITIHFNETVTIEGTLVIGDYAIFGAGHHINNGTIQVLGPLVHGGVLSQSGGPYQAASSYFGSTFVNNGTIEAAGRVEFGSTSQNGAGVTVNNGSIVLSGGSVRWAGQSQTVFGDDVSGQYDFHNSSTGSITGTGTLILGRSNDAERWQVPFRNHGTVDLALGDQSYLVTNYTVVENVGLLLGSGELRNLGSLINDCDGVITMTLTGNPLTQLPCNEPPTVEAGDDRTLAEGASMALDGASFTDPDSPTHDIAVDWGDGSSSGIAGASPGSIDASHVYADDGTYTVEICVTDDEPATSCDSFTANVDNVAPSVSVPDRNSTEGAGVSSPIAAFSDPGTADTHSATVDWGEGAGAQRAAISGSDVVGDHVYAQDGTYTVTVCVTDDDGAETCESGLVEVANAAPVVDAGPLLVGNEGGSLALISATFTDAGVQDTHTATVDWGDGASEAATLSGGDGSGAIEAAHAYGDNGTFGVVVCVTDDGGAETCATTTASVANVSPTARIHAPPAYTLVQVSEPLALSGSFSDPGILDTHTADWVLSSGASTLQVSGNVTESGGSGTVDGVAIFTDAGLYTVTLTVNDDDGGSGTASSVDGVEAIVVVFDPDGGFVNGGGWFDSPPGAYSENPSSGRAHLALVTAYRKDASEPDTKLQFTIQSLGFTFRSESTDWMVISPDGEAAQIRGSGTIDGRDGTVEFQLWAEDGSTDAVQIRIWADGADEGGMDRSQDVIYDNTTLQTLGGGNISIHD